MKLLLAVACAAVFAAVEGKVFDNKCVRLDVDGTVTITANDTQTSKVETAELNLSDASVTGGDCSKVNTSVTMTLAFKTTSWVLAFTSADKVTLVQNVTFDPATVFKSSPVNGSVTVSTAQPLTLSSTKASYQCDSPQTIAFSPQDDGNFTFTVSQNITSIRVQAFGLTNGSFSPAEHCTADQTTVAPTTVAPTTQEPTAKPVTKGTFVVKDANNITCFRLEAGLQFSVEYETVGKTKVMSQPIDIPGTAEVTGTCASGSSSTATMVISGADYVLTITETRSKDAASSALSLNVTLDPANFPNATNANSSVLFELSRTFELSSADTFYRCDSEQALKFANSSTTLYTNNVQLQAFHLKNGSFSGSGVRCGLDPTPSPLPPASSPGDNTYTVGMGNITCIVLKGEISFTNVTYNTAAGSVKADPINIPAMNDTTKNVQFSGSCNMEEGKAQQLVITFNHNWTLTLTFARGSDKESALLTASDEFSVRDIEFVYYLRPDFFPNVTNPDMQVTASRTNITGDLMKGSVGGGSYKCNADQTEALSNGVEFQTASLQFKAFNKDNSTDFSDDKVNECSADDESNSIVPIAVGAALAGLVAVVLIAYLIGRRRSRRQGYESV